MFIVFEGGEGSGKSTQANALKNRLGKLGFTVTLCRDPSGTRLGRAIGRWTKFGRGITTQTELLLFLACRSQLITKVIRPALDEGQIVICDRFDASTIAYQGFGRGIDLTLIQNLNDLVTDGLQPDIVILLDIEAEKGMLRRRIKTDCFEREEFPFHLRVREGYLMLAAANPDRWITVDADLPEKVVGDIIWRRVNQMIDSQIWPCLSGVLSLSTVPVEQ